VTPGATRYQREKSRTIMKGRLRVKVSPFDSGEKGKLRLRDSSCVSGTSIMKN